MEQGKPGGKTGGRLSRDRLMQTKKHGFTLVEALTVLAVMSIVLAIAVPSFRSIRERWAAAEAMHSLSAALAQARLSAVIRGVPVTLCPSSDGMNCRKDRVWDEGWIVYQDAGRLPNPATRADVLWTEQRSPAAVAIRSSSGRHRIRFQATGFAGGNNASLRVCTRRSGRLVASVVINLAGRARRDIQKADAAPPCPYQP